MFHVLRFLIRPQFAFMDWTMRLNLVNVRLVQALFKKWLLVLNCKYFFNFQAVDY